MNKLIICTAVAALGSVSQAAVLIGNLPAVNSLTHSADLGSSRLKGIGFTTPGQDWKLNSATFSLGFDFDDIANGVTPIVRIHDVVGGNPGSVLHTMVDPGGYISGSVDNYTFTANGSFTFLANTSYYIVMSSNLSVGGPDWKADIPGTAYSGMATYTNGRFTDSGGAVWTNSATLNSMQIDVDAVPEPMTLAGLALGAAFIARRRKRS